MPKRFGGRNVECPQKRRCVHITDTLVTGAFRWLKGVVKTPVLQSVVFPVVRLSREDSYHGIGLLAFIDYPIIVEIY